MSNFLAGVVRRGAGLPSPVTIRPAAGPEQLPVASFQTAQGPDEAPVAIDPPHARESVDMPAPRTLYAEPPSPAPPPIARPGARVEPIAIRAPVTPEASPARPENRIEPAAPMPRPAMAGTTTETIRARESVPVNVQQPRSAAERVASLQQTIHAPAETQRSPEKAGATAILRLGPPAPAMPVQPQTAAQRIEPAASVQPPTKTFAPAAMRTAAEPRNIQVKIGKVEIRSAQPVTAAPPPRTPAKGGFDDFALARNYLDRGHR
jgi:hypothetical protein